MLKLVVLVLNTAVAILEPTVISPPLTATSPAGGYIARSTGHREVSCSTSFAPMFRVHLQFQDLRHQ
jgi:hypothetical protein